MATTIITKHSPTAKDPQPSQLERGELAIDLERKNIYTKDASDEVVQLGGRPVKIGSTAPPTPQEGDLWMEVPTAVDQPAMMWVYDGDKWLEHPSGVDGAPGADGNIADATEQGVIATWDDTAKQWTPDSDIIIPASGVIEIGNGSGNQRVDVKNTNGVLNRLSVTASRGYVGTATPHDLYFVTDDQPRLTIDSTGNATFNQGVFGKYFALDGSHYMEKVGDFFAFLASSGGTMTFATGDTGPKLTIDATGAATFSGTVTSGSWIKTEEGGSATYLRANYGGDGAVQTDRPIMDIVVSNNVTSASFNSTGIMTASGKVMTSRDLIETLSTLRDATKDETTLEGLRDAIGNAVGGLIEKFEAMQNEAVTQDIQESPVTQEISNED
jgi:hypothetical protein